MSERPENDVLEEILCALRDEDVAVRESAIRELQRCSNSLCDDSEFQGLSDTEIMQLLSERRAQWLQQSRIVETLLIAMDDSSARVRGSAALMLMLGDVADLRAEEALTQHLQNDSSAHVRRMCAAALDRMPASSRKVEGFIAALKDGDYGVVSVACSALGRSGDNQAVKPLRTATTNSDWTARFYACNALVRLKAVDRAVIHCLERLNRAPKAKEHNDMVMNTGKITEEFAPSADRRSVTALTTSNVLERARRLFSQR